MKNTKFKLSTLGLLVLVLLIVGVKIAVYQNKNIYEITVTDKETKKDGSTSRYLIYADTDEGDKVFKNTDALFAGKFNSSDLQGELKVGKSYEVQTIGFRIPILSSYENVVEIIE